MVKAAPSRAHGRICDYRLPVVRFSMHAVDRVSATNWAAMSSDRSAEVQRLWRRAVTVSLSGDGNPRNSGKKNLFFGPPGGWIFFPRGPPLAMRKGLPFRLREPKRFNFETVGGQLGLFSC